MGTQLVDLISTFVREDTVSLFSTSLERVEGAKTVARCCRDWREMSGANVEGIPTVNPNRGDYGTDRFACSH